MMAGMRKGSSASGASRGRGRSRSGGAAVGTLGRPSLAMVLLLAGLLLASSFVAIEIQRNALARQAAAISAELVAAQRTNTQLSADVATKKTDDYVINKARDYGYVLPGETLIGVQQDPITSAAVVPAPAPSRLEKWLTLFFGAR
jgi:cell division protein FtsB